MGSPQGIVCVGKDTNMIGFILTGHGNFSLGVKSAIDMVAGDTPAFKAVPFDGTSTDTYAADLRAAISELREECDGVVVFCDLLGGTPFNQSMLASQVIDNVEVVAGVNLPMLIELIVMRGAYATAEETAEAAVTVGTAGVCHKKLEPMGDDEDDEM